MSEKDSFEASWGEREFTAQPVAVLTVVILGISTDYISAVNAHNEARTHSYRGEYRTQVALRFGRQSRPSQWSSDWETASVNSKRRMSNHGLTSLTKRNAFALSGLCSAVTPGTTTVAALNQLPCSIHPILHLCQHTGPFRSHWLEQLTSAARSPAQPRPQSSPSVCGPPDGASSLLPAPSGPSAYP